MQNHYRVQTFKTIYKFLKDFQLDFRQSIQKLLIEDVLGVQPILKYVYAKNGVTDSAICNQPLGIKQFKCEFKTKGQKTYNAEE